MQDRELGEFHRQAQYAISIELRKNLTRRCRGSEYFYVRKPVAYSDAKLFSSNGLVSKKRKQWARLRL